MSIDEPVEDIPQNNGGDDKPFDDEPFEAGVEADEESDPEKFIQQLSGKLGQSLRKFTDNHGGPDFDLEKFAINSVISATHSSEMDEEDQKDIISKIKNSGSQDGHEHDDSEDSYDHSHDEDGDVEMDDEGSEDSGEDTDIDIDVEENIIHEDDEEYEEYESGEDYEKANREVEYGTYYESGENVVYEGKGWAKLMKSIRSGENGGPWTIVIIDRITRKVKYQKVIDKQDLIPAYYEMVKKEYPGDLISIEDNGGTSLFNESFDPHQRHSEEDTMNLINKYNPTLAKIGKEFGKDSDLYRRFSDALSKNDEDFVLKLMKDSGIVMESSKKDGISLVNSKKISTFVNEFRNKLLEYEDMTYTENETAPVETPVITPTETPTRTPRRDKPFKTPIIKPGTEPRPKATI